MTCIVQYLLVILTGLTVVETARSGNIVLSWQPSASSVVAGYDVYFGTTSGTYPYRVDAGNSSSVTLSNLAPGVTYYLSATAYDANGNQSALSQEIAYVVPEVLSLMPRQNASSPVVLQFPAVAGHWYEIQASSDARIWTTIGRTSVASSVSSTQLTNPLPLSQQFTDPDAGSFNSRLYRVIVH
jgi:hypothetical protein